jgi:hypothetical protein
MKAVCDTVSAMKGANSLTVIYLESSVKSLGVTYAKTIKVNSI